MSCPCVYTKPCDPRCTCVHPRSSHGCARCCKYGSVEQRITRAQKLAAAIDAVARYASDARKLLTARGWKSPSGYTDAEAIKRLILDHTLLLNEAGQLRRKADVAPHEFEPTERIADTDPSEGYCQRCARGPDDPVHNL